MTVGRYGLVQLAAYAIDFGGFLAMLALWPTSPVIANVGGKLAAGLFAFTLHRRFTFAGAVEGSRRRQAILYFLLLGANIPVSSAILAALLFWLPFPAAMKFASDVICVSLTYLMSKHCVFARVPGRKGVRSAGS